MYKKIKKIGLNLIVGAIVFAVIGFVVYGVQILLNNGEKPPVKNGCQLNENFSIELNRHKIHEFSDEVVVYNYGSIMNTYIIKRELCKKMGGEEAMKKNYNPVCFICTDDFGK